MINELIFLTQTLLLGLFALLALRMGKSALVGFISLMCVLSNLFILKQITLFGFAATCCDAYAIGAVLGLNLLQEYYGKAVAQRAIVTSFVLLVCYSIMAYLQLLYLPNEYDTAQVAYQSILGVMPRIAAASLVVYLFVQYVDSLLYAKLRDMTQGKYLVVRVWISLIITQLLDTILFSFLGLYGLVGNIVELICISYAIKLIAIALAGPCVAASKWLYDGTKKDTL